MQKVTIYTDGSCSKNPGGDGAFAAILIHPKKTLPISGYIPAPTTNNRAEWAAVIEAVAMPGAIDKKTDPPGAIDQT